MVALAKLRSKDLDVRIAFTTALIAAGVDRASIRHEITLDSMSSGGRADIVLPLDHALCGIEIKSGKDTFDRLDAQHAAYGSRFDRLMLVLDSHHREKIDNSPARRWSFLTIHNAGIIEARFPQFPGGSQDLPDLLSQFSRASRSTLTSAHSMLELLWADELRVVAYRLGHKGSQRYKTIPMIAEANSLAVIRKEVAKALRERALNKWELAFWAVYDEHQAQARAA